MESVAPPAVETPALPIETGSLPIEAQVQARAPHDERYCPVAQTMRLLEQKWTLQIVKELVGGKRRFCQLQHALRGDSRHGDLRDVNPKTLSQRLKTLETYGIVTRRMISDIPPNVEYELTCRGHDLAGIIDSIDVWARKWMRPLPPAPAPTPAPNCDDGERDE